MRADAPYELWYADLTEFQLLPHLVRCWMRRGRQRAVPTPGKNKKRAAAGAWCYGKGLFWYTTQATKSVWGIRHLVAKLLKRAQRTGKRIVLVLDQGSPNHAHSLHRDLELAQDHIEVVWLPKYCWNLNLIERLWKHIKGSRIANVLFTRFQQFIRHIDRALEDFAKNPDLTLSVVTRKPREAIRKKFVGVT